MLIVLVLMLLMGSLQRTRADTPVSPWCYTEVTKNGKYVLVMVTGTRDDSEQARKLREKYPSSGLYPNDGSTTPLWRVTWWSRGVLISTDGQYAIKPGDWPRQGDKGETEALSFWKNGSLLKMYLVRDLVIPEAMPRSTSHYTWCRSSVFDEEKNQLTVETFDGKTFDGKTWPRKKYVFDVTTGEIMKDAASDNKAVQ